MKWLVCFCWGLCLVAQASAAGHGPIFGYATPVNSQGEWSFDEGLIWRNTGAGSQLTSRSLFAYGFTPHLQVSFTVPAILTNASLPGTRLGGGGDFESNLGWRFHHNAKNVGLRLESTAFAGIVVPGPQGGPGVLDNLERAPGITLSAATGLASRSNYVWFGGGYTGFAANNGDRRPQTFTYSAVYGYRPRALRKDYPFWDWRGFAELTGEKSTTARFGGATLAGSDAHQIFLGPSVLGIYKSFAISGGVQFPIYRDVGSLLPRERVRVALNVSYFLFQHSHTSH